MKVVEQQFGISFKWDKLGWSRERYHRTRRLMSGNGPDQIGHRDAIYLGAVGCVRDHVSL